jgi:hypothetical protein
MALKRDPIRTREFLSHSVVVLYRQGRRGKATTVPVKEPIPALPCPSRPEGPDNYARMMENGERKRKREGDKDRKRARATLARIRQAAQAVKDRAEREWLVSLKQIFEEEE